MTIFTTMIAAVSIIAITTAAIAVCKQIDTSIRRRQQKAYFAGPLRAHSLEMLAIAASPIFLNRPSAIAAAREPLALIADRSICA